MERRAWKAMVHGVTQSWTQLRTHAHCTLPTLSSWISERSLSKVYFKKRNNRGAEEKKKGKDREQTIGKVNVERERRKW